MTTKGEELTSGSKPVTATERKSLEKLIEADFTLLAQGVANEALALLLSKKNQTLRDLLRITVSDAAAALIDELPSAREIMAEAMAARNTPALTR